LVGFVAELVAVVPAVLEDVALGSPALLLSLPVQPQSINAAAASIHNDRPWARRKNGS
jgi:hypothetical protein